MNTALLSRSLRLFLPISGAITIMLVPLAILYEQGQRQALQERVAALVQAGSQRAQWTLQDIRATTAVVSTVPAMRDLLASNNPSATDRQQIAAMFQEQLRDYRPFVALRVIGTSGDLLIDIQRDDTTLPQAVMHQLSVQGLRSATDRLWLSPVTWTSSGRPNLVALRPLQGAQGNQAGALIAQISLEQVARDFDHLVNGNPALQIGYLLSSHGKVINHPSGLPAGSNFAVRFPEAWKQIQRQPYASGTIAVGSDLFLYEKERAIRPIAVVIQIPAAALGATSIFAKPLGVSLVFLVYLIAATSSGVVAAIQLRNSAIKKEQQRLRARLEAVNQSAGVGMYLSDSISGSFLSANPALCRFFERSEAELTQCTLQDLTHPLDLSKDEQLAAQLCRGDVDNYRLRKRFLRPDGSTAWGDLVVACTRNPDGTILDIIGQISDVSELVAKSAYLEAAASAGVVGIWDWDIEKDVITWDPVMYQLHGLDGEDFDGTLDGWVKTVHPDDRSFLRNELKAALYDWRQYESQCRVVWPDGSIHYLKARGHVSFGANREPLCMIGVNYDITEQVHRELELEQQRALLAATLDALVDPLLFLTLEASPLKPLALYIAQMNAAAVAFFGRNQSQLMGSPLTTLLPESDNGELLASLLELNRTGKFWKADEHPIALPGCSQPLYVDLRAVPVRDGVILSFLDVSERRFHRLELDRRARVDSLTGLLNRQEILEQLEMLTQQRRQDDASLAVLFCDIDLFKTINDTHGHSGGDAVLQALGERLRQCTRREDLVGRIGGDELLVVLQAMPSLHAAERIAAKIHRSAHEPLHLPTGIVTITLSIGVTLIRAGESIDAVVERADQAMYEAKQHGRDRIVAFS